MSASAEQLPGDQSGRTFVVTGANSGLGLEFARQYAAMGWSVIATHRRSSVPESLVQEVLGFLRERGYPDARAVHSAEESLIFALPKELRRDLKAAGRS